MKNAAFLLAILLLAAATLSAQNTKGAQPLNPSTNQPVNQTRAVVVGISDYLSPAIQDLQFADRDAEAFAAWLQNPAGGRVPADNVKLLTNAKATGGQFNTALSWLIEESKAGDQALIYFSGHGDVETTTKFNRGFLLCYDSPPTNYPAGAYSLTFLQDVISTLSEANVKTIVITDACRSGKLAGNSIGGAQRTAANLAQQVANEIKILSCQSNEYSIEGTQWGGGRGVFSYHLVDGLYGLADGNTDLAVSLSEVRRYLEDHVTPEVAPVSQIPMVVGNSAEKLALVDQAVLEEYKKEKSTHGSALSKVDVRGLEDDVLAKTDSLTRLKYADFKNALAAKNFFDDPDASADTLYRQLITVSALKPLHAAMRRNFAAALQDEVQLALNALLADDPYETNNFIYNPAKYADYPRYLHRTIELLGEQHYMYPTLRAKELFFEGFTIAKSLRTEIATADMQDSVRERAKEKMLAAIALDPQSAWLYYFIGNLYWYNTPARTDSLVWWCEQAIERAPQWLLPYLEVGYEYNVTRNEPEKAEPWLKKAEAINPNSYNVQERLSWLYQWMNRTDESLALSENMISKRPDLFNAYSTAGVTCLLRKEFDRSERYFEKAIALEPGTSNFARQFSIFLLAKTRRQPAAFALSDFIFNSPLYISERENSLDYLRVSLLANRQYEAAAQVAEKELKINPIDTHQSDAEATLGIARIMKGNYPEGRSWIQKAYKTAPAFEASLLRLRQYEAIVAEKEGQTARADSLFRAAFGYRLYSLSLDNRLADYTATLREDYARFLLRQNRADEAIGQIQKLQEEEPNSWRGYLCMAVLQAGQGHKTEALNWLEKALDCWLPTPELATEEPLFAKLRKTKRFHDLLAKHFPETSKQ